MKNENTKRFWMNVQHMPLFTTASQLKDKTLRNTANSHIQTDQRLERTGQTVCDVTDRFLKSGFEARRPWWCYLTSPCIHFGWLCSDVCWKKKKVWNMWNNEDSWSSTKATLVISRWPSLASAQLGGWGRKVNSSRTAVATLNPWRSMSEGLFS